MTTGLASAPAPARPVRPGLGVLAPFALGGGLLLSTAFAPLSWWPAAFAAVAVLVGVVRASPGPKISVLLGAVFGLAFNLVVLNWEAMISVESYLGLAVVEALAFAVLAGALHLLRDLRFPAVWSAGAWVGIEAIQARWPFGGFGWTRLGYALVDTPLAGFYPLAGAASVTFVVALVGSLLAHTVARDLRRWVVLGLTTALAFGAGALGALIPGAPADAATIDVGWVQGGAPGGGVYGLGVAGTMQRNHAAETSALMARVAAGEFPAPAFVVWPENGTDADPTRDAETRAILDRSAETAGVPILVTVPLAGPGTDERRTTALWWTASGPTAYYDKRNLVPFGEWIPFRSVLLPLIPMLKYVGAQTIPGTTPGVLEVEDADGDPLAVGVAICYEVAFPSTLYQAVDAGAEVMIVQSSNAMFQGSAQIEQQFAITRVRAAEMRREILVVTTSGISGLIDAQGRTVFRGAEHVADSGVVTLARSEGRTPVMLGGWLVEYLLAGAAAVAMTLRVVGLLRRGAREQ